MSLYEISNDLLTVINGGMVVDDETGEILFDADDIEQLEIEYSDKLEGCGLYVKNLIAEVDAIKAEERNLAERRKVKENKAERMRDYMLKSMDATNTSRLDTSKVAISTRKSTKVVIDDESKIPVDYVTIKQTSQVDKSALRKALKSGDVSGAHLEESLNLQLR